MPKIQQYKSGARLDTNVQTGRLDEAQAGAGGRMLSKAGDALASVAEQMQKARDFSETMEAKNVLTSRIQDLKARTAADPNPYGQDYEDELAKIQDEAGSAITSRGAKEAFGFEAQNAIGLARYDIRNTYRGKQIDYGKAGLQTYEQNAITEYTATDNPTQQAIILDQAKKTILQSVDSGFITREEGAKKMQNLANDFDVAKASKVIFADPARGLAMLEQGNFQHLTEEQKLTLQGKANKRLSKLKQDNQARIEQEQLSNSQAIIQQIMSAEKDPSIIPPSIDDIELARAKGAAQLPGGIDKDSYTAIKQMLEEPKAENVSQEEKTRLLENLADRFADLNPKPDSKKPGGYKVKGNYEKVMAYRKALYEANQVKGLVSPEQFQSRMLATDKIFDKGVNEYVGDNSKNIFGLWDYLLGWVKENEKQGVFNVTEAKTMFFDEVVDRLAVQGISQDQIPIIGKEMVRKYIVNKMPELAGLDDVPNNGMTAAGGFKKLYSGQSNLKPDFKTSAKNPAQQVYKPGDTQERNGVTWFRWSDGQWRKTQEQKKS